MSGENGRFDNQFTEVAARSGSIENLLHDFFGFLHRKTDFYVEIDASQKKASMGFPKGRAEQLLLQSFHQYPFKSYEDIAANQPNNSPLPAPKPTAKDSSQSLRLNEEGKQIPIGNGGIGPNYFWTQTLKEVTIYLDVPPGTRSKQIQCSIKPKSINLLIVSSNELVLEGELEDQINPNESVWTMNLGNQPTDPNQIVIILEKIRETWWKHVLIGHPEIDTTKVDSTKNISEYDEATQAQIQKVVIEHRQKQKLGKDLALSDEFPR